MLPEGGGRGWLHIYKDELFYDLCKRGLWGIQLANTQTFSLLEKTAAAVVNKTITDSRRRRVKKS